MLAQNFKTAKELRLTEKGYVGLLKVLRMLEGGELVYSTDFIHPTQPNEFNMATSWHETECGTVGCIGGWAGFYDKNGFVEDTRLPHTSLEKLFRPSPNRSRKTVEQAAHALRTYLVTGTPDWGA